jgi:N-acetylglucosamine kinase-like BadF-type ATPase
MKDSEPRDRSAGMLLVGVDGGGTKTEATLARRTAEGAIEILARGTAGPANLRSVSAADAWSQCQEAIARAYVAATLAPQPAAAMALGMAGAGSQPHRDAFAAEVGRSGAADRWVVTHDARPLIAGGTAADCGIALIAGTGSLAYCRTEDSIEDRCGGWGSLIGDEGSGYALTIAALRAAVAAWDGRAESTELLAALRDWIGETEIVQWPSRLQTLKRSEIARGATIVCEVADQGDPVADCLLDQNASDLAKHVMTLWQRCFQDRQVDLVFAGGLLVGSETICQRVLKLFITQGGAVGGQHVVRHPADSAVQLALSAIPAAALQRSPNNASHRYW